MTTATLPRNPVMDTMSEEVSICSKAWSLIKQAGDYIMAGIRICGSLTRVALSAAVGAAGYAMVAGTATVIGLTAGSWISMLIGIILVSGSVYNAYDEMIRMVYGNEVTEADLSEKIMATVNSIIGSAQNIGTTVGKTTKNYGTLVGNFLSNMFGKQTPMINDISVDVPVHTESRPSTPVPPVQTDDSKSIRTTWENTSTSTSTDISDSAKKN